MMLHFPLLLFIPFFELIVGEVYYITPSLSLSCPEQPCLTLSQFVTDSRNSLGSNVTLLFLPGNHDLQSELLVINITEVHMFSHSDFPKQMINISCRQFARLLFENVYLVHMSHLSFTGCGGNEVKLVSHFILTDSSFIGQGNISGTALEIVQTTASIIKSSFTFNSHGSYRGPIGLLHSLRIQYPASRHSVYALVGGALIVAQSNVNITDSIFEENTAEVGGAIFSEGYSDITVSNCTFKGNRASYPHKLCFGGAIYSESSPDISTHTSLSPITHLVIANAEFINNTACNEGGAIVAFHISMDIQKCKLIQNSAHSGGAVMVEDATLTIYDSQFEYNMAESKKGETILAGGKTIINNTVSHLDRSTAEQGGVLFATRQSNVIITDSEFNNNIAQTAGGVAGVTIACNVSIIGCQFSNNTAAAEEGGVLAVDAHSVMTIHDSEFYNNTAHFTAGAISIYHNSYLIIVDSLFYQSRAQEGAVLLLAQHSLAIINGSNFYKNTAFNFGGAFFVAYGCTIRVDGCQFVTNRAGVAGGVAFAQEQSNVTIVHSVLFNSTAQSGGVLNTFDGCIVVVEGSQFSYCEVSEFGGVFSTVDFSKLLVRESIFDSNTANSTGGIIFVSNGSSAHIDRCHFNGNKARVGGIAAAQEHSTMTIVNSVIFNTTATIGGVVTTRKSCITTVKGSQFRYCKALFSGGVFGVLFSSKLYLQRSTFDSNTAKSAGGVMFVADDSFVYINGSQFYSNEAKSGGVAAAQKQSNVTIRESVVFNTTAHFGGGVASTIDGSILIVEGSQFSWCESLGVGGVFTIGYSKLYIQGSMFENNTASSDGGVVFVENNSFVLINGSQFIGNNAKIGGVVQIQTQSNADFCDSEFNENSAQLTGGAVSVSLKGELLLKKTQFNNNIALFGGAVSTNGTSRAAIQDSTFIGNMAPTYGGTLLLASGSGTTISNSQISNSYAGLGIVFMWASEVYFMGDIKFSDNVGSVYTVNCQLYFGGNISFVYSTANHFKDSEVYRTPHGAITAFQCIIIFEIEGVINIRNNKAENGGGIYATSSILHVFKDLTIVNNTAKDN